MQVVLLERIEKLGQMGDVVDVKAGFGRNYLLPQGKALRASKENLAYFETRRKQLEAENLNRKQEALDVAKRIKNKFVVMIRQAGESGQLYGSVTSRDVADATKEAGVSIQRNQVILDNPLKTIGLHTVRIRLHPEVSEEIIINIARSQAEAEQQEKDHHLVSEAEQKAASEESREKIISSLKEEEEAVESGSASEDKPGQDETTP